MKIVLNRDYGGYGLSQAAADFLGLEPRKFESGWGADKPIYLEFQNDRTNPKLIECIETLGEEANGPFADLNIIEIPDEATDYKINDYDGWETILYVVEGKILEK